MKISIVVYDTRGGVQPMLALAVGLIKKGHEVKFCANPENEKMVTDYHCPFVAFGPNVREQMKINAATGKSPDSLSSVKGLKKEIENQIRFLPEIIKDSDLVLASGIVFGVRAAADIAKVPFRLVIFYPSVLGPGKNGSFPEKLKFKTGMFMLRMIIGKTINHQRKTAGLPPVKDASRYFAGEHILVASDAALKKVAEGVNISYDQTGYLFLPPLKSLPKEVEDFIASGKPPVFISFGSNPIAQPEKLTRLFEEVAEKTGQRLIVSKGWAELTAVHSTSEILYVEDVPFELLFPRMALLIHHGGSGTLAYAAKAGIPQIVFPYMFDQFENQQTIVHQGLGPKTCSFKKISASALITAIHKVITDDRYRQNAAALARMLKQNNGLEEAIQVIEKCQHFTS